MRKEHWFCLFTTLFGLGCAAWLCWLTYDMYERNTQLAGAAGLRAQRVNTSKQFFKIGLVYDSTTPDADAMQSACESAIESLNKKGGILGRRIILEKRDDRGNVFRARRIAQDFANQPDIGVVIGHSRSDTSLAVAPLYQFYGILSMSPSASNTRLTDGSYPLAFSMFPNDKTNAKAVLAFADAQEYKRIAILQPNNTFGVGYANHIETEASRYDVQIADRITYPNDGDRFSRILKRWQRFFRFDAVVLIVSTPAEAEQFFRAAKEIGFTYPVILNTVAENTSVQDACNGYEAPVYVRSLPKQDNVTQNSLSTESGASTIFSNNVRDSLYILAQSATRCGHVTPVEIAENLRAPEPFAIDGRLYSFSQSGGAGREILFNKITPTGFQPVYTWKPQQASAQKSQAIGVDESQ